MARCAGGTVTASKNLKKCDTLMLDMDGTLLDLAYDNYMWLTHIPAAYARARGLPDEEAQKQLYAQFHSMRGTLEWYCLDHWSERLQLDIVGLHHAERDRIGWLPRAREFLQQVRHDGLRVLLVTNAHPDTLHMKSQVTGLEQFFDSLYTAHEFGVPKERPEFWQALAEVEAFDPHSTMFVDDTEPVLESAARFGVRHVVRVTRPDTTRDAHPGDGVSAVESVGELLG